VLEFFKMPGRSNTSLPFVFLDRNCILNRNFEVRGSHSSKSETSGAAWFVETEARGGERRAARVLSASCIGPSSGVLGEGEDSASSG
jgi:hypothetical protein